MKRKVYIVNIFVACGTWMAQLKGILVYYSPSLIIARSFRVSIVINLRYAQNFGNAETIPNNSLCFNIRRSTVMLGSTTTMVDYIPFSIRGMETLEVRLCVAHHMIPTKKRWTWHQQRWVHLGSNKKVFLRDLKKCTARCAPRPCRVVSRDGAARTGVPPSSQGWGIPPGQDWGTPRKDLGPVS